MMQPIKAPHIAVHPNRRQTVFGVLEFAAYFSLKNKSSISSSPERAVSRKKWQRCHFHGNDAAQQLATIPVAASAMDGGGLAIKELSPNSQASWSGRSSKSIFGGGLRVCEWRQ
jgi:hypothetical protein